VDVETLTGDDSFRASLPNRHAGIAMRTEFVGREAEFAVLSDCLDAALDRRPRIAVCSGEPGIGKTRLAQELVELAVTRNVTPVWGLAVDSAGAPPFWPWRQVLRAVDKHADLEEIADRHRLRADLATLAPEIFGADEQPTEPSGSAEDRFRLFDAVARLLREVTTAHPLLIVLDDAHSADHPSVLLLQHLARVLSDEALLMLVNCRDTEPGQRALVAALVREQSTRELHLRAERLGRYSGSREEAAQFYSFIPTIGERVRIMFHPDKTVTWDLGKI
jgi:hypothetical protein